MIKQQYITARTAKGTPVCAEVVEGDYEEQEKNWARYKQWNWTHFRIVDKAPSWWEITRAVLKLKGNDGVAKDYFVTKTGYVIEDVSDTDL